MRVEERRYWDRRAPEYDDWYLGRGPFEGVEQPGWNEETRRLEELLAGLPSRRVLDFGPDALAAELGGGDVIFAGRWYVTVAA